MLLVGCCFDVIVVCLFVGAFFVFVLLLCELCAVRCLMSVGCCLLFVWLFVVVRCWRYVDRC